ncbi:pyrroline-5-carboxylate reductase [Actinomyces vulturis]|uniref:pyrroline-5-carboxylate reductase n=1 Tax=Actinomyces vulturis TaxID=1857645 RepID=UPI00082FAD50|nr:pyrroline-5-carboxylate reductase [Actinomyces vulturis]
MSQDIQWGSTRKLGVIGCGNMAGAIVRGLVTSQVVPASSLYISSASGSSSQRLADEIGAHASTNDVVAATCDVIILGIKPHIVPEIAKNWPSRADKPLIISIAAGLTSKHLEELFPSAHVVRTMPNMAAAVRASVTAVCPGRSATDNDTALTHLIMGAVGSTVAIPESSMSTFIALAGSSPAFVFRFIEALSTAGVLGGFSKEMATRIVTQAVVGSALSLQESDEGVPLPSLRCTPAAATDAVCSPGGTTIAGLVAMEESNFSTAVIHGARATMRRDQELGQ